MLNGIFNRKWAGLIEEEVHYADKMFNGFLMGKLLDSAIIGIIFYKLKKHECGEMIDEYNKNFHEVISEDKPKEKRKRQHGIRYSMIFRN